MNSTFRSRAMTLAKDLAHAVIMVWAISVIALQTGAMLDDHKARTERRFLEQLQFEEILLYHGIYPRLDEHEVLIQMKERELTQEAYFRGTQYGTIPYISPTVAYKAPAYFVSDSEVLAMVERITGGVQVSWDDALFCDRNPYDSREYFTLYREAEPTGFSYTKARARRDIDLLGGYPLLEVRNNGYQGNLPVIQYPDVDADCELRSIMRMQMPSGRIMTFEMTSHRVQVRGVL